MAPRTLKVRPRADATAPQVATGAASIVAGIIIGAVAYSAWSRDAAPPLAPRTRAVYASTPGLRAPDDGAGVTFPPFSSALPASSLACDCVACSAVLASVRVAPPAAWGADPTATCECGACVALVRLALRSSLASSDSVELSVDMTALTRSFPGVLVLSSLFSPQLPAAPCPSCAPPAPIASEAAPAAAAAVVVDCQCPPPCPSPSSDPSNSTALSSPGIGKGSGVGPFTCGANAAGGHPAWLASQDVRGFPAPPCSVATALGGSSTECVTRPLSVPIRCNVGRHADHWTFFSSLVRSSVEPFALLRYVDGERRILQGTPVATSMQAMSEDKWFWDGGDSRLARDMAAGLRGHYGEPVFYAFASPADDEEGLRWYLERTEATCGQITYANLWVNDFYKQTKPLLLELLSSQATRIVLIANHEGINKFPACVPGSPGALLKCVALPDDAVHTWEDETKRAAVLASYLEVAASAPVGSLFITCGGPLSKPLIAAAWDTHPIHQYVDFGSTMDEILKGRQTRPYMRPHERYYGLVDPSWYCDRRKDGKCGLIATDTDATP